MPGELNAHHALIQEQFSRQAVPFANSPAVRHRQTLERIVADSQTTASDTVLDVGCGPGILACAYGRVAKTTVGVDLTLPMLQEARAEQQRQGIDRLHWVQGDAAALPWPDGCFSLVVSRLTFHHLLDPLAVLREMMRVCRSDGRVVVVDVVPEPDKAKLFNEMERLRDPSHVRALTLAELSSLFDIAGLTAPRITRWRMEGDLESLLARSFPLPGDDEKVRGLFRASLEGDILGVAPHVQDDTIFYAFPMAALIAERA